MKKTWKGVKKQQKSAQYVSIKYLRIRLDIYQKYDDSVFQLDFSSPYYIITQDKRIIIYCFTIIITISSNKAKKLGKK